MRTVVGWGCMPGELCVFCEDDNERKATVYVYDTETGREDPACNECSCGTTDEVGQIFVELLSPTKLAEQTTRE